MQIVHQPKINSVENDRSPIQKIKVSANYWNESVKISMNRILSPTMKHIKVTNPYSNQNQLNIAWFARRVKRRPKIESVHVRILPVVHHQIQTRLTRVPIPKNVRKNERESIRNKRNRKNPRKRRRTRNSF